MADWANLLTSLYDHLEDQEARIQLLGQIDQQILRATVGIDDLMSLTIEDLLPAVDGRSGFVLKLVDDRFVPTVAVSKVGHQPNAKASLRRDEVPPAREQLSVDSYPVIENLLPPSSQRFYLEVLHREADLWGLVFIETDKLLLRETDFIRRVCRQLSVGLGVIHSRSSLQRFEGVHASFFERELDEQECLNLLAEESLKIVGPHEGHLLVQILFRETPPEEEKEIALEERRPLVIRWSSGQGDRWARVPFHSFSGVALASGKSFVMGDPSSEEFASSYQAFSKGSRTELAVVFRKAKAGEGFGVLNIESSIENAFPSEVVAGLVQLVELVVPALAAVRKRFLMARQEKRVAAFAMESALRKLSDVYSHRIGTPILTLDVRLHMLQQLISGSPNGEVDQKISDLSRAVLKVKETLKGVWAELATVAQESPIVVGNVIEQLAKEEASIFEEYVRVEAETLEALPPVRASGLLKEHLRNVLKNSVKAFDRAGRRKSKKNPPEVVISGDSYAVKQTEPREGEDRVARLNRRVRISIRDNGVGMDLDTQRRVFKLGFSGWKGTGFGLPAARQYARELGGNVDLKSERGLWTLVWMDLPVYIDEGEP